MTSLRRWCIVGVCAIGLAVAGCDSQPPPPAPDTTDASDLDRPSPLAEFFGWRHATPLNRGPEFTEQERQEHYRVQANIVDCMGDAGFEYIPEPFPGDDDEAAREDPLAEVWALEEQDPEAFVREYGYGITTLEPEDQLIPLDGVEPDRIEELIDPSGNPNLEYRAGLSDAARREYDRTLTGYYWAEREAAIAAGEEVATEPAGCRHEALVAAAGSAEEGADPPEFADLTEAWGALYERIESDPRVAAVALAWAGCMTGAGYPGLEGLWAAQELVRDRQSELYQWTGDDGGLEPEPAELAEAREFELAIAWADFECRQEHEVERVHRDVQFDHEARFIDDHRKELESYRDWLNELDQ